MPADFRLFNSPPRPSVAPQPLPSSWEMRRIGEMATADRAIAAGRNQRPNPAEVARQTQAMQAQQLARYKAQLDAADRAIQAGRNQTVNPAQVQAQTQAMQAQQLARYKAALDARDAALRPRPKPIGLPPGISPQPQVPSNQISQPVNKLPRPTTPTLQPRPTNISAPIRPRLPASIGNVGRGVIGAAGGSAGAIASLGPIVYDGSNAGFDAAFPQLAPYRPGIQNAAALAGANPLGMPGLANHPLNPLNPMGRWWDWAPWNQGKNPNSLNPDPQTSKNQEPDPNGDVPIQADPNTLISFTVTKAAASRYSKSFNGELKFQDTSAAASYSFYGIPVGLRYTTTENVSRINIGVKYSPAGQVIYTELTSYVLASSAPNGTGFHLSAPQISISAGPATIPQTVTPSDLSGLEPVPATLLEPDAPQQYEPIGRPEAPPHPTPQPAPQPLPQQIPRPSPLPRPTQRPQPAKDPTAQPNPFPQPDPDPQAPPAPDSNPSDSPWPWFDPDPFKNPFSPFNPANNPGIQPYRNTSTTTRPLRPDFPGTSTGSSTSSLDAPDILTAQYPQTQPEPLPKPAPEADMCKDPCIADMHDTSKGQKPKSISYKVFKKCGDSGPEFETKTLSVPSDQADALKILLDDAADRQGEKCSTEQSTLTIPEWWAVRPGADRPQFCIMYAEKFSTGKLGKSRWQLTIPHYNRPKGAKPQIPEYKKGNWMGTLTLTDNSKIRINAASASECRRVLNKLKILIPVDKRTINGKAIKPTILERADGDLKECTVTPIRGDFYKTGQKQSIPDWVVKFR